MGSRRPNRYGTNDAARPFNGSGGPPKPPPKLGRRLSFDVMKMGAELAAY
jgi:hypothetical protein